MVAYQKGNSFPGPRQQRTRRVLRIAGSRPEPGHHLRHRRLEPERQPQRQLGRPAQPAGRPPPDLKRSSYGADWSYWDTNTTHLFSDLTHRFANGWQMKLAADKLWARINMLGLYNDCYY